VKEESMSDETTNKPKLEVVPSEAIDEEEREFMRLRRDVPGVKGASDIGLLTVSIGRQPSPRNEFYRTNVDFRPVVDLVTVEAGMDKHFIAVDPCMVETLHNLGISTAEYTIYLIISPRGSLRAIPVRRAGEDGTQNEWDRTKEIALLDGVEAWHRMYVDRESGGYKSFPAPRDRFGEPCWPVIKHAKLFRMLFRDRGHLILDTNHMYVQRWAGRDKG
jgi:hypothetical protein